MNKAILWDMDGVLADSGDAHYVAWQEMFQELGRNITRQEFDDTFGMANGAILRRWLGADLSEERSADLARRKEALFRQHLARVRLLPGVLTWLDYARAQGYYQVVASSGEMANIVAVMHALGVGNYFHGVVSGAFLPQSKPHRRSFGRPLRRWPPNRATAWCWKMASSASRRRVARGCAAWR